ncbi:hypothetical protein HJC23_005611 [Cyclotella cryptica]|uniref:Pentatricopeptide repeat-containing protein n=1 Tax=Cyclotella cryptica TaxID=29204 RepID=A0ABD3PZS2_9STRA|eukprot:CCRYP_010469-RA/>CCRYP_010469-RA protein AED:0.04 eAED:0.04 QI:259/1/1/1/0.66/0.5/4/130/842
MTPQYLLLTCLRVALALTVNAHVHSLASFVGCCSSSHRALDRALRPAPRLPGSSLNYSMHSEPNPRRSRKNGIPNEKMNENHEMLQIAKMQEAEVVERVLSNALDEARIKHYTKRSSAPQLFPSVRQCNAAIATFGDAGDFRRALKLFTQMRKSVSIIRRISRSCNWFSSTGISDNTIYGWATETIDGSNYENDTGQNLSIDLVKDAPAPTLVTYSTLMSRAVSVGKPRVAIRLWNLMKNQPNFYTNVISRKQRQGRISDPSVFLDPNELHKLEVEDSAIVPDVIFCNTLMNAYAKLGDHKMARFILNSMLGSPKAGNIVLHEIPQVDPTVVTFNTLADACKEAGDLAAGLEVLELMSSHAQRTGDKTIAPDARTYTILISTVARKTKQHQETRDIRSGGERDPDKAFDLLNEMISKGVHPNGITFCALIDVCSRCRRYDLALNGLRIMLSRKKVESNKPRQLFNEVGAWTAAINACGKAGRIDTAMRLFETMQRFSVKPNAVTCASLTDSLVKAGKITETLEVLQYMKNEGLSPGEVMYTSLMSSLLGIAKRENDNILTSGGLKVKVIDKLVSADRQLATNGLNTTNSIVLYTELMRSMVRDSNGEDVLLKIFLVFQEMKAAGVSPDLPCYNALLRACSFAGDADKAQDVLRRIDEDGLEPNDASWREALKAAAKEGRSDVADTIWNTAVSRKKGTYDVGFVPRVSDVDLLISTYWQEAQQTTNHTRRAVFHRKIVDLFEGVQMRSVERGLCHVPVEELEQNQVLILTVLRAAVSFVLLPRKGDQGNRRDNVYNFDDDRIRAKELACKIAGLNVLQGKLLSTVDGKTKKALGIARDWMLAY